MKKGKAIAGVVGVFITLPIWFYLLYTILNAIHVDRLVWFLFWVYVPLTFAVTIALKVLEAKE